MVGTSASARAFSRARRARSSARAGPVVDVRADPEPEEGLRAPDRDAEGELDGQQDPGEALVRQPPGESARGGRAPVAKRGGAWTAAYEEAARVGGVVAG